MINNDELEAMGIIENTNTENKQSTKNITYNQYTFLLITCFLFPLIGFISGAIHIDSNDSLAKNCLTYAWLGVMALIILVVIIMFFAFA